VLGIFISPIMLPPKNGAGTNNQVQVSGTISENHPSEVDFTSGRQPDGSFIRTSSIIINGNQYNVVLVGGISYSVLVSYTNSYGTSASATYTIYVPSGVTTFTANF
jgi:hypothetical protein